MESYMVKIFPENATQFDAIKAFMKTFRIKFEVEDEKTYNPEFVKMVLEAEKEIEEGKGFDMDPKDIDKLWEL
mgnify:CR=1 FL=1